MAAFSCATTGSSTPDDNSNAVTSRSIEVNGTISETNDIGSGQKIQVRGTPIAAVSALAEIYNDLKIPIGTMAATSGQIGNSSLRVPSHRIGGKWLSDYLNCGMEQMTVNRADASDVSISIMSTAVAVGDSASNVTTTLSGFASSVGSSSNTVPCQSTGALEHQINVRLAVALAKSA